MEKVCKFVLSCFIVVLLPILSTHEVNSEHIYHYFSHTHTYPHIQTWTSVSRSTWCPILMSLFLFVRNTKLQRGALARTKKKEEAPTSSLHFGNAATTRCRWRHRTATMRGAVMIWSGIFVNYIQFPQNSELDLENDDVDIAIIACPCFLIYIYINVSILI